MANELALPDRGSAAWPAVAAGAAAPNPLTLLPADWIDAVGALWVCNAHLLPSALSLCGTLRVLSEQGITTDDLRRLVAALLLPERRVSHRFASDLIADLCGLAAKLIQRRRSLNEAQARRDESDAFSETRKALGSVDLFRIPNPTETS